MKFLKFTGFFPAHISFLEYFFICFQPRDQFATRAWIDQPSMVLDGQRYARQSASDSSTSQSPDLWSFRNVNRQQTAAQVHVAPAVPSVAGSVEPMEVDTSMQSNRGVGNPEVGGKKTSHFDSAGSQTLENRGLKICLSP